MLRGSAVVNLVNAIAPIYLCIALGFVSSKLRILPHAQTCAGIGGFVTKFSLPFLVFRMVATIDAYQLNGKLILADTLYKAIALFVLCLTCFYRPTCQYVAWVSTLFNLATFSNLTLIGVPLLTALYPGTEQYVAALVFMQLLLWLGIYVLLLETYKALNEMSPDFEPKCEVQSKQCVGAIQPSGEGLNTEIKKGITSPSQPVKELQHVERQQPGRADVIVIHILHDSATKFDDPQSEYDTAEQGGLVKGKPTKGQIAKKVVVTVLCKVVWVPMVWGSILGFIFALLNFKFNHGKALPASLSGLVDLMANCSLGICMFMLGMNMGVSPHLFAGGLPMALLGVGLRFIVAPASMAVLSYAVGLRGTVFRFAVMQLVYMNGSHEEASKSRYFAEDFKHHYALELPDTAQQFSVDLIGTWNKKGLENLEAIAPQAIISFAWSIQYNLHADIFRTAVWFQAASLIPFAIALDMLLNIETNK